MINIRFEGNRDEYAAIIERMRWAGIEVQINREKKRDLVTHAYTVGQLGDPPAADQPAPPIRVKATVGEPVRELPAAPERRPARRRR